MVGNREVKINPKTNEVYREPARPKYRIARNKINNVPTSVTKSDNVPSIYPSTSSKDEAKQLFNDVMRYTKGKPQYKDARQSAIDLYKRSRKGGAAGHIPVRTAVGEPTPVAKAERALDVYIRLLWRKIFGSTAP